MRASAVPLCLAAFTCAALALATASGGGGRGGGGFGTAGVVRTDFGGIDGAAAVAVQRDGRIVVAGGTGTRFALARYLADGRLDRSFGKDGTVVTDVGTRTTPSSRAVEPAGAYDVAIQGDGKIVAAGAGKGGFVLVRYHRDGRLDGSFGVHGRVQTSFGRGGVDRAAALAVQPDRKIVAAGGGLGPYALARYLPNGQLDRSFGHSGKVTTASASIGNHGVVGFGDYNRLEAVTVRRGQIIAAGSWFYPAYGENDILLRYLPDGRLDRQFAAHVRAAPPLPGHAIAVQPDGRIVVAGKRPWREPKFPYEYVPGDVELRRYTAAGRSDSSFHPVTDLGGDDNATALALQPDGAIVAAGGDGTDVALVRYLPDGRLDSNFGRTGIVTTGPDERTFMKAASDVAIQADGKIIVVGGTQVSVRKRWDFVVVRYNGDGSRDS